MTRDSGIQLIVNGDDLGLHPSIDEGILRANREGILTSTTLLVTGPTAESAIGKAKAQKLGIGLHLCLTGNLPAVLPQHASLAPSGRFRKSWVDVVRAWALGRISMPEVERELTAQLIKANALGANIDHLDSHQHLHVLPPFWRVVGKMARESGLPVRWPAEKTSLQMLRNSPTRFARSWILKMAAVASGSPPRKVNAVGIYESGALTEAALLNILDALTPGIWELCCHPGAGDIHVPEDPQWHYPWQQELDALCSPKVSGRVQERGINLVGYAVARGAGLDDLTIDRQIVKSGTPP